MGEELHRGVIYLATDFSCPYCGLEMRGTAETNAAGLDLQRTVSLSDTFMGRMLSHPQRPIARTRVSQAA